MLVKSYDAFPSWSSDCLEHLRAIYAAPENQRPLLDLIADFTLDPADAAKARIAVRLGKPVKEDFFPCIAIEMLGEDDPWFSGGYTREVRVDLWVNVCMKAAGSATAHPVTERREVFIGKLAAVAKGLLSQPQHLQSPFVTARGDFKFDSKSGRIEYGYMYDGAVRVARFQWFASFITGPTSPGVTPEI